MYDHLDEMIDQKPVKHLTLEKEWEGYDPMFHRDPGKYFVYRCATTGKTFTKFDAGNYRNLCTSFICQSCNGHFSGTEMDQPYALDT